MKHVKLYEDYINSLNEAQIDTIDKFKRAIGKSKPTVREILDFIYNNFSDITGKPYREPVDFYTNDFIADIIDYYGYEEGIIDTWKELYEYSELMEEIDEQVQGQMPVNIMIGRFQPFHNGHYLACKELHDKNGLPVVIVSVRSKGKSGKGTNFTESTMNKMMKDVIKKSGFIIDHVEINYVAFDTQLFPALRPKYEPVLFGAGEDRIDSYKKQTESMRVKHGNKLNIRDDFDIYLTGRYASGTEVREAIINNDRETFENKMPEFLWSYWDILKKELD